MVGPENNTGDYISYNVNTGGSPEPFITEFIAAGMGVFVKSLPGGGTVTFKNSDKVAGNNDQFFKDSENPDEGKSWFRLSGSMGYSPILIGFVPEATDGYEDCYDGEFLNEGALIEFYSFCDSYKLEIQGRSVLQSDQIIEVPLGYQVLTAGDYTISMILDYIDTSFEILLEDTLENTITNLRTSDYTFNVVSATEDNSRFILRYNYSQTLGNEEFVEDLNNINSFFLNDELKTNVNIQNSPLTIQLFNMSGKEILNTTFHETLQTKNLSTGIYVVKYGFEDSKIVSKKVIKK